MAVERLRVDWPRQPIELACGLFPSTDRNTHLLACVHVRLLLLRRQFATHYYRESEYHPTSVPRRLPARARNSATHGVPCSTGGPNQRNTTKWNFIIHFLTLSEKRREVLEACVFEFQIRDLISASYLNPKLPGKKEKWKKDAENKPYFTKHSKSNLGTICVHTTQRGILP